MESGSFAGMEGGRFAGVEGNGVANLGDSGSTGVGDGGSAGVGDGGSAGMGGNVDMGDNGSADREGEDYERLARELMRLGFQLARLRPAHELESSSRGLPAVMQSLACADGPLSPGEIARATHVTDARVANALRVLEARGLVERRASSKDRRRVEVLLTEKGRADIRSRDREGVRFMAAFLRDMGEDDAHDLVRLLGRVVEVVERRRAAGVGLGSCKPYEDMGADSPEAAPSPDPTGEGRA